MTGRAELLAALNLERYGPPPAPTVRPGPGPSEAAIQALRRRGLVNALRPLSTTRARLSTADRASPS